MVFMINRTVEDDVLREIFQNPTFAQALSLAIDRDEINEVFYFGLAQPRQYTVLDTSQYFEPEFATAYAEFDPTGQRHAGQHGLGQEGQPGL